MFLNIYIKKNCIVAYIINLKNMELPIETIMFVKSNNSIGDMQKKMLGFWSSFMLGRCSIGNVRNHPKFVERKKKSNLADPLAYLLEKEIIILKLQ